LSEETDSPYWIAAGTYTAGQVLGVPALPSAAGVPFGTAFSMDATLNPDNTWTITPSAT
jgi:hypothetical protein